MLLRTRISLLGILVVVTVSVFIMFAAFQREQLIRLQYSQEVISDQSNLWSKIKAEYIGNMEDFAWIVRENRELIDSVENDDREAIRRIGRQSVTQLQSRGVADRIDVIDRDGNLVFSSQSSVFPSPIISEEVVKQSFESLRTFHGVGNDKQRNTAIVFGTPLINDFGHTVGLAVLSFDIVHPLAEMENLNNSSVMILNRRGRLLVAPDEENWERFSDQIDLNELGTLQTISDNDRHFSVTVLPQVADLGSLVGRLVNIEDVTDQVLQQRKIGQVTIVLIIAFTIISLLGLYFYMRRAFVPLTEGVEVLEALSRGDLMIPLEVRTGKDEVGQIGNAVNVFRAGMLMLNRYRRSRERQRARQERFIFREMTELADTLDGEDQAAVLKELKKIAKKVEKKADDNAMSETLVTIDPNANEVDASKMLGADSLTLMATAFHSMSERVQDQHQRLRDALATKESLIALRKELDIATRVQLSLLPNSIEKSEAFEIAGGMWPAKEVGGDFFDYFRIDEDHIGIAIADVSGKGVPAALFAVMARTLLRGLSTQHNSPREILERVNNFLENNNDENLFITFFYCVLEESTGRLTYANGGHNSPILVDSAGGRPLEITDGMVLGMFEGLDFDEKSIELEPNSRLLFLTDGIPEAFNSKNEAYGDDRLLDTVSNLPDGTPNDDVKHIVKSVDGFVGSAPQFDDITCLMLHFKGAIGADDDRKVAEQMALGIDIKRDLSEIGRVAQVIEDLGETGNWPKEWIFNSNLALDELITNVVNYGDDNPAEEFGISLTLNQTDDTLTIVLEDDGEPFDPFSEAAAPDIDAALEDRPIGGLGIHFVKSLTDEVFYERRDERNRVTLIFKKPDSD